ncbi:cupin domain-containing protein [Poriferisphaera sp. WC338]|uniref:cupin domain-containing protein n=1 Tax=Poriferisphaera sp. WC338 TaxID=3425129 RepID=UPI003D81BCE2
MVDYTLIQNLSEQITIPDDGTLSVPVQDDANTKTILFGFAQGQSLSEHTASVPATIQIIQGNATVTLGSDAHAVCPGSFIHMQPNLPHSITADTPLIMLLMMIKAAKP